MALNSQDWTPPSAYLGDYGSCPTGHTLNRLIEKGLAIFRYQTWTRQEARAELAVKRKPGRETAEFNAAMKLTPLGVEHWNRLAGAADR